MSLGEEVEYLTASILGAAFELSNTPGHGFLEVINRQALFHKLSMRCLAVGEEVPIDVIYK